MQEVKVIVKQEKWPNGESRLVFFFPESQTNPGNIECWCDREGHCEASMGYYWKLKNPYFEQEEDVAKLMRFYERNYQVAGPFKLKRVARDNQNMRRMRWKWER